MNSNTPTPAGPRSVSAAPNLPAEFTDTFASRYVDPPAEFNASAGPNKLPQETVEYYVDGLSDPDALHGSFQLYRAFGATTAQNHNRKTRRLPMPVLAIGAAHSLGAMAADTMKLVADNVQTLVIPGIGHWLAEEAPDELVAALTEFLAGNAAELATYVVAKDKPFLEIVQ
jgi:pimeloyl-ACP methyl ester carboxylesterase